ncbi:MAG TPA: hypothetical protein VMG60_00290 [Burkholderiaceae bacterium]|nr:hypothetical protein [Burkholderiaceae bacterium]
MNRVLALLLLALAAVTPGRAETSNVGPTGFVVTFQREVNAPPEKLWNAITQLPAWWSSTHTWSGKASSMSIDLRAAGCWCEAWDAGSVMHGTVVLIQPGAMLRLYANLGPLQDKATAGVLTFAQGMSKGKTLLKVVYRISGPADTGLVELSAGVDKVLAEQVERLVAFAETGKAE